MSISRHIHIGLRACHASLQYQTAPPMTSAPNPIIEPLLVTMIRVLTVYFRNTGTSTMAQRSERPLVPTVRH